MTFLLVVPGNGGSEAVKREGGVREERNGVWIGSPTTVNGEGRRSQESLAHSHASWFVGWFVDRFKSRGSWFWLWLCLGVAVGSVGLASIKQTNWFSMFLVNYI